VLGKFEYFLVCNCLAGCIWVNFLRVNMLALCLDAKKILERKTWVCDGFLTAEKHVTGSEMSLDYYYYFLELDGFGFDGSNLKGKSLVCDGAEIF
jgi:hypothetical protein